MYSKIIANVSKAVDLPIPRVMMTGAGSSRGNGIQHGKIGNQEYVLDSLFSLCKVKHNLTWPELNVLLAL